MFPYFTEIRVLCYFFLIMVYCFPTTTFVPKDNQLSLLAPKFTNIKIDYFLNVSFITQDRHYRKIRNQATTVKFYVYLICPCCICVLWIPISRALQTILTISTEALHVFQTLITRYFFVSCIVNSQSGCAQIFSLFVEGCVQTLGKFEVRRVTPLKTHQI